MKTISKLFLESQEDIKIGDKIRILTARTSNTKSYDIVVRKIINKNKFRGEILHGAHAGFTATGKLIKKLNESQEQKFSYIYSQIKPKVQIKNKDNDTLEIQSIEDKKRLKVARILNLQTGKTQLYSFPEIAVLVNQHEWTII